MIFIFIYLALLSGTAAVLRVNGRFEGQADWYEFVVDPNKQLGGDIVNFKQYTRIEICEQTGPFIRGTEWYQESENSWKFVANLFGIISPMSPTLNNKMFSVRMEEWLNEPTHDVDTSRETLGLFTGVLTQDVSSNASVLSLQYTGATRKVDKFGAQHMQLSLQ